MTDSIITNTLNHVSSAALLSGFVGGVGYLCARVAVHIHANWQLDPRAGLASGAAAGAILGLFFTEQSSTASKIVALVALVFIPFKWCERLEIPITFKQTLALTGAAVMISCSAVAVLSIFD